MIVKVIAHSPLTQSPAKLYHPNIVENQCASKDIMVSKIQIGELKPKITMKIAEYLKLLLYEFNPPSRSSLYENLDSAIAKKLYTPIKITSRIKNPGAFKYTALCAIKGSKFSLLGSVNPSPYQ